MKIITLLFFCFTYILCASEVLCIPDACNAEFSGNDKIIFTRRSTEKAAIYSIKDAKITDLGFPGNSFASLSGEKLFFCGEGIFPQLFLYNTADGKTTEIPTSEPPSGTLFRVTETLWAFPSGYEKIPKLLFIDTKSMQEVKPVNLPPGTVNVSSDGKYAAIQFDNGTCNIKVVEISTGKTVFITETVSTNMQKNGCHSPVFSPDGKKLLYVSGDIQPIADIMLYDLEKRKIFKMTRDGKDNQRPRWSADGKSFVHSALRDGKYCIAVIKI